MAICAEPGCPVIVPKGRCPQHSHAQRLENRRFTGPGMNYGRRWQKAAKEFLAEHPWCVHRATCGHTATLVDHRIPHRGDETLFWDRTNWQPMCVECHGVKTAEEVRLGSAS